MSQDGDNFILLIGDNGPGLKADQNDEGLGLSLIEILCDQIDAELEIQNKPNGLLYKITFQVV